MLKYTIEQISDRLEIQDLTTAYADAIDQQAIERLDEVFTADAFLDYSAFGGPAGSYAEAKAFLLENMPVFQHTQHFMANHQIQLESSRATGKVMCLNPIKLEGKSETFFLGLWYIDEYVRTEQGWRISKRTELHSWNYNAPDFIQAEA